MEHGLFRGHLGACLRPHSTATPSAGSPLAQRPGWVVLV